ncbi:MAG: hypothetical protein R2860_05160 [Desulfobacterales bacterium]
MLATTVLCILLGSVAVPASTLLIMAAVMLGCCVPASRLIARFVEKKKYTFSVQGPPLWDFLSPRGSLC